MKKALSILITFCILIVAIILPVSINAATFDNWEYTVLADNSAEITGYDGYLTEIIIPSELDGHTVSGIGQNAFTLFDNDEMPEHIVSITIPDTVVSIGKNAFARLGWVESIVIGNGVKTIGNGAFEWCYKTTSLTIGSSVEEIGYEAFRGCYNLEKVTLPKSLKTIGGDAFYGCEKLTSILIPENVESIGDEAFINTPMQNMILGSGVKSIGENIIDYNEKVFTDIYYTGTEEQYRAITVHANNPQYKSATVHYNAHPHVWDNGVIVTEVSCAHDGIKRFTCDCGETYDLKISALPHKYTVEVKPKGCVSWGVTTYTCTECGFSYNKVYDNNVKGHKWNSGKITKQPTFKTAGVKTYTCSVCGEKKTEAIAKLVSPSITKLTAGKKAFTVTYKKAATVAGYEVQYATNSKFTTGRKTVTVKGDKAVKKTIKKLKGKKKYYVRVRAYKTINGKKVYSSWSKAKSVKTK